MKLLFVYYQFESIDLALLWASAGPTSPGGTRTQHMRNTWQHGGFP
jgi:hypothetical protein